MPLILRFNAGAAFVDFNGARRDGRIAVDRRVFTGLTPLPGDVIVLHDHEGNSVDAVIQEVHSAFLRAKINWTSWSEADRKVLVPMFASQGLSTSFEIGRMAGDEE